MIVNFESRVLFYFVRKEQNRKKTSAQNMVDNIIRPVVGRQNRARDWDNTNAYNLCNTEFENKSPALIFGRGHIILYCCYED